MSTFEILPAIDLREGRVVRLRQGDFDRETSYGPDPVAVAEEFVQAGARSLHVVDLDGARIGTPRQLGIVATLIEAVGERAGVEVAGGLRSAGSVAAVLALGARRAVVGTAVMRDPGLAAELVGRHGADRIVAALDVRDGRVATQAWTSDEEAGRVEAVLGRLADAGIEVFEVTAIDRDGELSGPDLDLLGRLVALDRGSIVASAGVRSIDDLRAIRGLGCTGAIVGRALYEGQLNLGDAIAALEDEAAP